MPQASAPEEGAAIAHRVLTAMGLVRDFAPLVLLAGHGSQSANNAHAAGLDCGACGGQTGEVNARALADLLNPCGARAPGALGITIPSGTHFVPACTTPPPMNWCCWISAVPPTHTARLERLRVLSARCGGSARGQSGPPAWG